jgi:DNA-binding transcriptional MerR regulator
MALMSVAQVAEFLGVQVVRVERLERESLLVAKQKNDAGDALFDEEDVKKYKELAARLGGI